mmetsp:Transcript_679/g.74  ORF Transcript_679/g.74 Transcript_679/m.74 type:complete len:98 (-) Transcript_679:133-426(-)
MILKNYYIVIIKYLYRLFILPYQLFRLYYLIGYYYLLIKDNLDLYFCKTHIYTNQNILPQYYSIHNIFFNIPTFYSYSLYYLQVILLILLNLLILKL